MSKRPRTRPRAPALALASASLLAGLALVSSHAAAQTAAYTSEPVDLYAGPSGDYPVVSQIGPGVPVTVMGCGSAYSLCDITVPGVRGWVYAGYLSYPYQGAGTAGPTCRIPSAGVRLSSRHGTARRDVSPACRRAARSVCPDPTRRCVAGRRPSIRKRRANRLMCRRLTFPTTRRVHTRQGILPRPKRSNSAAASRPARPPRATRIRPLPSRRPACARPAPPLRRHPHPRGEHAHHPPVGHPPPQPPPPPAPGV